MLQITEDTPPDMLAGAMDLTVHLPTGRAVKMAVERSTPMMDLLVQITTNHHLQLSGYTIQALGMAPSAEHSDHVLPYKPNTPIGALDTQHIRVLPKPRTIPKNIPPGQQPFESTFRLKVHLPRNQLYVTRVSRNVLLEDIMKKVCEEKNLDPIKYELKHPGNLDEVLDPKLTLSDYQITEIYIVSKGTVSVNQAFSTSDIMALRKEEERKQLHNKTGGGVFNLIFRRGKSSMGSGSLSSENRSISPSHSDDSRSVTPPAVQPPIITPPKPEPPQERPKPPQRKRRPAPKPPQHAASKESEEKAPSNISDDNSNVELRKNSDSALTICHSRNSSDSSGYHEASILSDNCNTSLPRRPKSAFVNGDAEKLSGQRSQSTSNLSKMSSHSKSTSSLAFAGRKKKAAPPPPQSVLTPASSTANLQTPSPVVASQPLIEETETPIEPQESLGTARVAPHPAPRLRQTFAVPVPRPRSSINSIKEEDSNTEISNSHSISQQALQRAVEDIVLINSPTRNSVSSYGSEKIHYVEQEILENCIQSHLEVSGLDCRKDGTEEEAVIECKEAAMNSEADSIETKRRMENTISQKDTVIDEIISEANDKKRYSKVKVENICEPEPERTENINTSIPETSNSINKVKPPEVVAVIPKVPHSSTKLDTFGKRSRFKIGNSLLSHNFDSETSSIQSRQSSSSADLSVSMGSGIDNIDDIDDINEDLFTDSPPLKSNEDIGENNVFDVLDYETERKFKRDDSVNSLRSVNSLPSFLGGNMKKWNNMEDLDDISVASSGARNKWVFGDTSDTESVTSTNVAQQITLDSLSTKAKELNEFVPPPETENRKESLDLSNIPPPLSISPPPEEELDSPTSLPLEPVTATDVISEVTPEDNICETDNHKTPVVLVSDNIEPLADTEVSAILESEDWQYQLPSPPKAFRDSSPTNFTDVTNCVSTTNFNTDSVVTSPELFEKLKVLEDNQSEKSIASNLTSVVSDDDKPILNKLSLEHLEKRKSLVYNRELATSLKMTQETTKTESTDSFSSSLNHFETTYDEVRRSSLQKEETVVQKKTTALTRSSSTLPNFKITTYDNPKQRIKVFEDDTVRSNTESVIKRNSLDNTDQISNLNRTYVGRSMENISYRKNSFENGSDDESKKSRNYEYNKYSRPPSSGSPRNSFGSPSIFRSESFSAEQQWSPSKPVSRSKSHLSVNKYKEEKLGESSNNTTLAKSNSLYDGLQSLGVMKLIQNKLNTPTNSTENLTQYQKFQHTVQKIEPIKTEVAEHDTKITQETTQPTTPLEKPIPSVKTYQYRGPPSINMGTWSERPKLPVTVKEDADYKLSNHNVSSKLIVNTINNNITSNNSIEVKTNTSTTPINVSTTYTNGHSTYNNNDEVTFRVNHFKQPESRNVSIKVNGSEPISTQTTGNVVIKIGSTPSSEPSENQRFITHTTAAGYRKPFGNVNKIQPRPHSIAFDSDFDISRVPIVRSVELKKPFKDLQNNNNTSVTHIYQGNNNFRNNTLNRHNSSATFKGNESKGKFSSVYCSSEALPTTNGYSHHNNNIENNKSSEINIYRSNVTPVVRGFKTNEDNKVVNKMPWSQPNNYFTLPTKPVMNQTTKESFVPNRHVPFSQSNLRRTESNRILMEDRNIINNDKILKANRNSIDVNNEINNSYNSLPVTTNSTVIQAPPPPQMPKPVKKVPRQIEPTVDPRDQLLSAIRNFGGKKGLKSVKV